MSEQDAPELLQDQTGNQPAEAPAPEPVIDPTKDETGLRDTLKAAMAQTNAKLAEKEKTETTQPVDGRDPVTGKFTPKQAAPDKVEQPILKKPSEGAQPEADPARKPDAAPGTWKPEARAKWDATDALVKAEVLRRESESTREVAKFQQQLQLINQAYTPIEQLIGPRRALWRAQHGSEGEALKKLLNLSDLASQDPNAFIAYYASSPDVAGRLDLQKVFGQQAPGDDINRHPVVQQLQQTVDGLKQQVSGFLSQHQTQATQSAEQQIAEFVNAKGNDGSPLRPHFEQVREDVFNLIPALKAQFPNENVSQVMERAYNVAIRTNDNVSGEIKRIEEQRIRDSIEKEERLKKAQLANKSIPPGAPAPHQAGADPNDLRATLRANFAKFNGGEARI